MQFQNFNDLIHAERGKLLRRLPPGAKTICSAGCAGSWYFRWVEAEYGRVDQHIGVELYSPKPDDLPDNVQWIANSVSEMTDVGTGSVDLLISGQNIEHLYYEDIVGFLSEANRVVRDGGYICIDSPNRVISDGTQPQHVLELSVPEAIDLVEAAGFSIVDVHGIWSCADGVRRFSDPNILSGNIGLRCAAAENDPHGSFIWWIVATKTTSPSPDLETVVERIVARSFRPFVATRFRKRIGRVHSIEGTELIVEISEQEKGFVFYGPFVPLRAGKYRAEFDVKFTGPSGTLELDVVAAGARRIIAKKEIKAEQGTGEWRKVQIDFNLGGYTEGVETRLASLGANAQVRFGTQIMRLN